MYVGVCWCVGVGDLPDTKVVNSLFSLEFT